MKSDLPYLSHIDDAIAAIEIYVADGREIFLRERMIQDAVIRNFEVIGEAVNRLSSATRDSAGPVWKRVIAFPKSSYSRLLERGSPTCLGRHPE